MSSVPIVKLSEKYCSITEMDENNVTEQTFKEGIAIKIIDSLFGSWLRSTFENLKDQDNYNSEVSNLDRYGAG